MLKRETVIKRLLWRTAKQRHPLLWKPSVPFGADTDPNREFATRAESPWFFAFLPIFMLLYAIVEKMHVR
jgi:hypothetical protein